MELGELNFKHAFHLFDGLVRAGVNRVVISPGARSTPLVLAAAQHPEVKTHVVLDERSAGFFAIGLAKSLKAPVALVCTSGTAVANWHPAVLEADAGKIPLILLSADRPPEIRSCGANQTTDQIKLFGNAVRAFHELPTPDEAVYPSQSFMARLVQKTISPLPGPVHLNIPFREPLLPSGDLPIPPAASLGQTNEPQIYPNSLQLSRIAEKLASKKGLIVCGWDHYSDEFPTALTQLAERLQKPVLADPLANLRVLKGNVFGGYDAFLKNADFCAAHKPEWVLRFGAMPISKSLGLFLASADQAHHIVVDSHGSWQDPLGTAETVIHADPIIFCECLLEHISPDSSESDWLNTWAQAENKVRDKLETAALPPEAGLIADMAQVLPANAVLFSGNSTPVRHLDSFLPVGHAGFQVMCNRGLSGIDGCVSTPIGIAMENDGPVVALLGDLTMTHDLTALGLSKEVDITFVVINNAGGGIFEYLPHANLDKSLFETYWLTPNAPDLAQVTMAYGCRYHRIEDTTDFKATLQGAVNQKGCDVIEVFVDRMESVNAHKALWKSISEEPLS